jgi:hypothetical protein
LPELILLRDRGLAANANSWSQKEPSDFVGVPFREKGKTISKSKYHSGQSEQQNHRWKAG